MSTTRHIVYVTPVLPWPPDQGARHFQLEAARALATVGRVAWITRRLAGQDAAESTLRAEGFDLQLDHSFASRSPWARLRRRLRIDAAARWKREPREIHFVSSPGVKARVRAMAAAHSDAWFVGAYWSTARALGEAPAGRRVLLAADVESNAARAGARFSSGGDAVARRLSSAERDAFRSVDHLLCLTAEDEVAAAELLDDGGRTPRIGRWPVGLSVPEPCAWPPPAPAGPRLLAYGHWQAEFNRDGLDWFLREIWPAIRTRHPAATVRIVGRGVESVRRTVAGVEWVGYVEDLRAELEACHVVAIPLRYAGGIRYRLIEALGYGRPVVCTSVAAAGADARAGETHLQADDPASWAEAVERAVEPEPARRLRDAGRVWARTRHGLEESRAAVRDLFADLEGRTAS